MADSEKVLISMPLEDARELSKTGKFVQTMFPPFIPSSFLEQIRRNLEDKTGNASGVVMCVSRLSGRKVSIDLLSSEDGYSLQDLMSIVVGDVIMEFLFPSDQVLSIGVERLNELCRDAIEYGEDDEGVLEELSESLVVGVSKVEQYEDDVYSFLSELTVNRFQRGYILDDSWEKEAFRTSTSNSAYVATLSLFK